MNFAIFARPVVTIYDLTETTKESDAGVVSTIGDEGLYGQVCQVRTAPGGVTAEGVTLPEEMAAVVSFYGYHGYVFASELRFCGEAELRSYLAAEWVMAGRATDVLTLPKVQGVRLLELERGALLRRLPEEAPHDGWALVRLVDGRTGYVRAVELEPVRWPMTAVFTQQAGRRFDEALALAEGCRPEELVPRALDRWYGGSEEAFRNALAEQAKRHRVPLGRQVGPGHRLLRPREQRLHAVRRPHLPGRPTRGGLAHARDPEGTGQARRCALLPRPHRALSGRGAVHPLHGCRRERRRGAQQPGPGRPALPGRSGEEPVCGGKFVLNPLRLAPPASSSERERFGQSRERCTDCQSLSYKERRHCEAMTERLYEGTKAERTTCYESL